MTALRLGTRGSQLAVTQSQWVADRLTEHCGVSVELVHIRSLGDDLTGPLSSAPQPGVFVSRLRDALLAGDVDLVVHSMKDLPAAPLPGVALAAVPVREDSRDVLVSYSRCALDAVPAGARVGTSSPRRAAHLRALRPDLEIVDLRGNIDSRIARVRAGEIDAAVLAAAGLRRIGREDEIDDVLESMLSAPAQGALAVEVRSDDRDLLDVLAGLDDANTRRDVLAEREVLAGLAATCTSAVAARASAQGDDVLELLARVGCTTLTDAPAVEARLLGRVPLGDDAAARDLGHLAARLLLARGAGELLTADGWPGAPASSPTVWVTRPVTGARADVDALRSAGARVLEVPVLQVRPDHTAAASAANLVHALRFEASLLAVTSAAAVDALVALVGEDTLISAMVEGCTRGLTVAAVGTGTARSLERLGARDVLVPSVSDSEAMVAMLASQQPGVAVLPRGNLAMRGLQEGLEQSGWSVMAEQVYLTETMDVPDEVVAAVHEGAIDAIVLRSPSAVSAVRDVLGGQPVPPECLLVAGGRTTAASLKTLWPDHGGQVRIAAAPSPVAVAEAVMAERM